MTQEQIQSMAEYYAKKYGKPENDNDGISKLTSIYRDLFDTIPNQDIKDGIGEYYRILSSRGLPAYQWILEALHVTSKKEQSKRNFSYIVGMLRSWLKYGFGHIPNQEEDEIAEIFKEVTGHELTLGGRRVLQKLMGMYGAIKVTRMVAQLNKNMDMSLLFMMQLEDTMNSKYEVKKSDLV